MAQPLQLLIKFIESVESRRPGVGRSGFPGIQPSRGKRRSFRSHLCRRTLGRRRAFESCGHGEMWFCHRVVERASRRYADAALTRLQVVTWPRMARPRRLRAVQTRGRHLILHGRQQQQRRARQNFTGELTKRH